MSFELEISKILSSFEIEEITRKNLVRLFEYTQYLFDKDENLTKTLNLTKSAKDSLIERIVEMFEQIDLPENQLESFEMKENK